MSYVSIKALGLAPSLSISTGLPRLIKPVLAPIPVPTPTPTPIRTAVSAIKPVRLTLATPAPTFSLPGGVRPKSTLELMQSTPAFYGQIRVPQWDVPVTPVTAPVVPGVPAAATTHSSGGSGGSGGSGWYSAATKGSGADRFVKAPSFDDLLDGPSESPSRFKFNTTTLAIAGGIAIVGAYFLFRKKAK
jgi:hypothetical protein